MQRTASSSALTFTPRPRWRAAAILGLAALLALPAIGNAQGRGRRLDQALRDKVLRADAGSVRVIVRTAPGTRDRKAAEFQKRGHARHGEFSSIDGVNLTVRVKDLETLSNDPDVLGVSLDAPISAHVASATETALRTTLALPTAGFSGTTGYGVGVAVIDSGIAVSTDMPSSRIRAFRDFTTGQGAVVATPVDGYGHGTHVASLVGGSGALSTNSLYQGLAPNVSFIGLRVLNNAGEGSTSSVIAAIEWAIANRTTYGIHVINLSLGHPIYEPAADRPARAGGRSRRARRHRGGGVGRQLRASTRRRACPATRASRRPATRRRPLPSGRSTRRPPRPARTTPWPRTARAGRPGTTPTPSRTWSRRGTAWSAEARRRPRRCAALLPNNLRRRQVRRRRPTCVSRAPAWPRRWSPAPSR